MSGMFVFVVGAAVPVGIVALGAVLIASGVNADRGGAVAVGTAVIAGVLAWTSFAVEFAQGWLAAVVLPSAFVVAALLYARGRRTSSHAATTVGAALAAAATAFALEPVLETSWSPAAFDAAVRSMAAVWLTAAALLFAIGVELLRAETWSGWIPYGARRGAAASTAIGFSLLVLTPAFAAVLSNVGA